MKVVHVATFVDQGVGSADTIGGLGRFLEEIIPAQRCAGLEVTTVDVTQEALTRVALAVTNRDWIGMRDIGWNIVGDIQADIFHFHDWYGAVILDHLYREGHRAFVATSHLPLRRGFTYRDSGLDWHSKAVLESRCLHAVKRVTAPSQYVKKFLVQEYGLAEQIVDVIPHGVNSTEFCSSTLRNAQPGSPCLLAVGRITDQKGFELLVRAMVVVLATEPAARLTIIGNGGAFAALAQLVVELALENAVTLKNGMSKLALIPEYSSATLLVIPSQFEPFGLVGLEAMACGCPVLAIAPTGAEEYLVPHELTYCYTIAGLGKAILKRIDQIRCDGGVRFGVRTRAERMTWNLAADAYAQLYSECVN